MLIHLGKKRLMSDAIIWCQIRPRFFSFKNDLSLWCFRPKKLDLGYLRRGNAACFSTWRNVLKQYSLRVDRWVLCSSKSHTTTFKALNSIQCSVGSFQGRKQVSREPDNWTKENWVEKRKSRPQIFIGKRKEGKKTLFHSRASLLFRLKWRLSLVYINSRKSRWAFNTPDWLQTIKRTFLSQS